MDVFGEAMKRQKLSKLTSKGEASESAGEATDMLTGSRTRTVGTAEDPLNYFLGKQLEKFPGFDPDEAWRTHPISEDAAVTIMNAGPFVDACTYSTYGSTVYYLPYVPREITAERALFLYRLLRGVFEKEDMTPVERAYETLKGNLDSDRARELRFYVTAVMKHQSKRFDVFGDTMNGRINYPVDLSQAHFDVLESWAFDASSTTDNRTRPPLPSHENWDLLNSANRQLRSIVTGYYFVPTFSDPDDDQDASADDVRIQSLVSVLGGDPIAVETLLGEYVDRLVTEEGEEFPRFHVASQFAQLCALARAGLVTASDTESHGRIAEPPRYDTTPMSTDDTPTARADGGSVAAARADKLEQFIDATPALEDDERRGAFLLGALIGQVSGYQQGSEGRSTTLADSYPIKSMTRTKFKRVTHEVIDQDIVYSRDNDMGSTMYAEIVDRLVTTLTERDPDEWSIGTDDLRFYYALGVSYGLNNWTTADSTEDS
jgi:CRISPR-associated protein Cas8b/Csh1 subtype I-B